MVRLRLFTSVGNTCSGILFQSHYGAIATRNMQMQINLILLFSIPLWCDCDCNPSCHTSFTIYVFNPTMVRLRPYWRKTARLPLAQFSIPLWCDCDSAHRAPTTRVALFSIPLWCDCDWSHGHGCMVTVAFSIPLWCDCDPAGNAPDTMLHVYFQSHYGAIATRSLRRSLNLDNLFNPTMVRLRQ